MIQDKIYIAYKYAAFKKIQLKCSKQFTYKEIVMFAASLRPDSDPFTHINALLITGLLHKIRCYRHK